MGKSENTEFNTVGLIGRRDSAHVADSLSAVVKCLAGHGVRILVEDQTAALLARKSHQLSAADADALALRGRAPAERLDVPSSTPAAPGSPRGHAGRRLDVLATKVVETSGLEGEGYGMCSRQALGERCGLIVVVGGDGSLLSVGRDLAHAGVPVVGINRGGLGFLADIAPKRIDEQLGAVLAGEYRVEDHFLLEAKVLRESQELARSPALNDVVVNPGSLARMMEFSLAVNGEFVYDQRSDGLIVASPTGSTAYALSAGGPIMHPSLDAIVIVPMYPHTLTSRPLVVRGDSTITVTLGAVERAQVSCDSQVTFDLESGDQITIEKYAAPLRLVYAYGHSFYESCRSKLDWATRLGGQR